MTPGIHYLNGDPLTVRQLAERAGCTVAAMKGRLSRYTPAQAVELGGTKPPSGIALANVYEHRGQTLTTRQLADMVGCPYGTMKSRLLTMSLDEAVALGAPDVTRVRPGVLHGRPPGKPGGSAALAKRSWNLGEQKTDKRVLKPAEIPGEPVRTAKTVVTVAPTPRDRFYVDPAFVVPTFTAMRPGEYLSSGSAVERAYGGAR